MKKSNQYTISQMYFLDKENSVMVHLTEKKWNHRNKIGIEIKCNNENWKFRYLGFGNIEGELVVKLFLLNGNLEKLKENYSKKNAFLMLVYENERE